MRIQKLALLATAMASSAMAQPVVQAVVNGASYSANLAPGTWAVIYGTALATPDGSSDGQKQGIGNLLVMGVHTDVCVLKRSFAIRQMSKWGIRCVRVRDLTDTMYDPKTPLSVAHEQRT
jgi:nicotinamidase-related amidase